MDNPHLKGDSARSTNNSRDAHRRCIAFGPLKAVLFEFPQSLVDACGNACCNSPSEIYICTTGALEPALRQDQAFTLGPRAAWPDDLAAIFLKDGRIMLGYHAGSDAEALYITESNGQRRRGIRRDSIARTAPVFSVTEIFR